MLSQELERVNGNLRTKVEESNHLDNQLRNSKLEIEKMMRAIQEQEVMTSRKF